MFVTYRGFYHDSPASPSVIPTIRPSKISLLLLVVACHRGRTATALENSVRLRADSTQYTVRANGEMYQADIGFRFDNHSGRTLSKTYCMAPAPPVLEKERASGEWMHAYSPIELTCLTFPPFRIADGETYRGMLRVTIDPPGSNVFRLFGPDSIPGTYRLRWELRASADPNDQRAPIITAVSPPFTLSLR